VRRVEKTTYQELECVNGKKSVQKEEKLWKVTMKTDENVEKVRFL
jgi:hypothetical protein